MYTNRYAHVDAFPRDDDALRCKKRASEREREREREQRYGSIANALSATIVAR